MPAPAPRSDAEFLRARLTVALRGGRRAHGAGQPVRGGGLAVVGYFFTSAERSLLCWIVIWCGGRANL